MNYLDIVLIIVGAVFVLSGLTLGISSQFLFPVVSGLFGASLLSEYVLNWLKSPNQVVVLIVYVALTLIVGGLALLIYLVLRLTKNFKVASRVMGLITALVSLAFVFFATKHSILLFMDSFNDEFVEMINQSLLLSYIR